MGFLEKLWDETLAGPTPETGLGKLRKYNSFSAASSGVRLPPVKDHDVPVVTRSIMIIRNTVSEPVSPSSSAATTPRTPNTPDTPGGYFKKFTRRKASGDPSESSDYRSPTISDWVIMSALDRC
ncbi:dormancy-associated protein homolog 4 isoform X1 [Medicago truncatula]|uniref:Dormancy/auxin associated protein n=1 Tax=Medicago truncatula TaxID=3880 RepID=G7L8C8_MEDTR|nr:dormancy-associated protein homolog 4 isoform X1 [Medicago truncatula]AET01849.1 dormancy/auxin associated protein [Medicago truncatula]